MPTDSSSLSTMTDTVLPEYEDNETQPLPLYSQIVRSSECLLPTEASPPTNCPACEWIFTTKHMKVNLGRRRWKIAGPAYGINSNVEGTIYFEGTKKLEAVTATLEGCLKTSYPERISSSEDDSSLFLRLEIPIRPCGDETVLPFSIPIPAYLRYKGQKALCPPSFWYSDAHFMCEIVYSLRFNITWQGRYWKKSKSYAFPIYYLPKTNPAVPPICVLPPASRHMENPPLFLQGSERMESIAIPPKAQYRSASQPHKLQAFQNSVYLSLPLPTSVTSGQEIPFMISLYFPSEPYLSEGFAASPDVQLYKSVEFYRKAAPGEARSIIARQSLVSSATIRKTSGWQEGMVVLKGEIQAGDAGAESSWEVKDSAHVRYILRVCLKPPHNLSKHIPMFTYEAPIEICTSSWGSLEREMASSGGMMTPAVSMADQLRRLY